MLQEKCWYATIKVIIKTINKRGDKYGKYDIRSYNLCYDNSISIDSDSGCMLPVCWDRGRQEVKNPI